MGRLRSHQRPILDTITQLLRDRYHSGYPILKELLQNADDAGAHRFRADFRDAFPGSEDATNRLLRVPGVFVLNDGRFSEQDMEAIGSFAVSRKADDSAQAGKFGIGQKAVFHLCDAFIVFSRGHGAIRPAVVNPFHRLKGLPNNAANSWEKLRPKDKKVLDGALASVSWKQCLGLWIPFRSQGLRPALDVGFSSNEPSVEDVCREWRARDDVTTALTLLRHVREVAICRDGAPPMVLRVSDDADRLVPPQPHSQGSDEVSGPITSRIRGRIHSALDGSPSHRFVGQQVHDPDPGGKLGDLKRSDHWPRTLTALSSKPKPEKGEAHGAVTLWRRSRSSPTASKLTISWAVFLPVSSAEDITIKIPTPDLKAEDAPGHIRVLLHGYFFLDSGRQRIDGVEKPPTRATPTDEAELRRAWNGELCNSIVLPRLPLVLRDALDKKVLNSQQLLLLVAALAKHLWFRRWRRSICRKHALVRVLDLPESGKATSRATPSWRIIDVKCADAFRPLPNVGTKPAQALADVFPSIHPLAARHDIKLCIDPEASLTTEDMEWPADDLTELFRLLSRKVFQLPALARFLATFLEEHVVSRPDDMLGEVQPYILQAVRRAMIDDKPFASDDSIRKVLGHLPTRCFCALPNDLNRHLLRVLARADTEVLPVRKTWLPQGHRSSPISATDAVALIRALVPELEPARPTLADRAVSSLIDSVHDVGELARHPEFSSARIFRVRCVRRKASALRSLLHLKRLAFEGLLFKGSPRANKLLPIVADALPTCHPIIAGKMAEKLLAALGDDAPTPLNAEDDRALKRTLSRLVNQATKFGKLDHQSDLLQSLLRMRGEDDKDDIAAMRRLCIGSPVGPDTVIYRLAGESGGLDRIIRCIFKKDRRGVLISGMIDHNLTRHDRNRLRIMRLNLHYFHCVVQEPSLLAALKACEPTESERCAFFRTRLPKKVLQELAIFRRTDGSVGNAKGIFRVKDWPVPPALQTHVPVLKPCEDAVARKTQKRIVEPWSPRAQINKVLAMPERHRYCSEILEAVVKLNGHEWDDVLRDRLRGAAWMVRDGTAPVSPKSVFNIPDDVVAEWRTLQQEYDLDDLVVERDLQRQLREHAAFQVLRRRGILPSGTESLDHLRTLLHERSIVGRLGPAQGYPIDAFAHLARARADLALPGWQLLASLLRTVDDSACRQSFVECFAAVGKPAECDDADEQLSWAVRHLNALADLASVASVDDARLIQRAYRHGLSAVAEWSVSSRHKAFRDAKVPTKAGEWRPARKIVMEGTGLDPRHVLDHRCAEILRHRSEGRTSPQGSGGSGDPPPTPCDTGPHTPAVWDSVTIPSAEVERRRAKVDGSLEEFLDRWLDPIPGCLAVVFCALLGARPSLKTLAGRWSIPASETEGLWDDTRGDLDLHFEVGLNIEIHSRTVVPAESLSGDDIEVPLDSDTHTLIRGNAHKSGRLYRPEDGEQEPILVYRLQVHDEDIAGRDSSDDLVACFRDFVTTVAIVCLPWGTPERRSALDALLDKCIEVGPTTLRNTKILLRDQLPSTLSAIKPPRCSMVGKALRKFREREMRIIGRQNSDDEEKNRKIGELKLELWNAVDEESAISELLRAVRARINEHGYSSERIIFELFQNADDAYCQIDTTDLICSFGLVAQSAEPGSFRAIHWGRPINHYGDNVNEGYRRGYGRDLLNMLLMSLSEKRGEETVTGRFGLGFKSVHLLSDNVGIASGSLELRIHGGLIPRKWDGGVKVARRERANGLPATVVDVPWERERQAEGRDAVSKFRSSMAWLLLFSRRVGRIELRGDDVETLEVKGGERVAKGVHMVAIDGSPVPKVLRFGLNGGKGEQFHLILALDGKGPTRLPSDVPGLWNLAPLEEGSSRGCLLNGPFKLDPGRARLSGSVENRQQRMKSLGEHYGHRLRRLYDAATRDWDEFARTLHLDRSEHGQDVFWCRLFEVVGEDLHDGSLSRHLHGRERGYGMLAGDKPVVPTGLPDPCDGLVKASSVRFRTAGALESGGVETRIQRAVFGWPGVKGLVGSLVAESVASQLERLGFGQLKELTVSEALRRTMGDERHVAPYLAAVLGEVINMERIDQGDLSPERREIMQMAQTAFFRGRNGGWHPARALWTLGADGDDKLLSGFAPASAVLHPDYRESGLKFFRVAKYMSGRVPRVDDMDRWARSTRDDEERRAVLGYVIRGERGRQLAGVLKDDPPLWFPRRRERFPDALVGKWSAEDKARLERLLGRTRPGPPPPTPRAAERVFRRIHDWWRRHGEEKRRSYSKRVYPDAFIRSIEAWQWEDWRSDDSLVAWFTMFALACFQHMGRVRDEQARIFVERAWKDGWWQELVLGDEARQRAVADRLQEWSDPGATSQEFVDWRRRLVDLYAIARGIEGYARLMRRLPQVIRDNPRVSLVELLRPAQSETHRRLGTEAPPIDKSLGFGVNWMIRELVRFGSVYGGSDGKSAQEVLAPHCWARRKRIRDFLNHLDAGLGDSTDMDRSRNVWRFIAEEVGEDNAHFFGDFDLPIQLLAENRPTLDDIF